MRGLSASNRTVKPLLSTLAAGRFSIIVAIRDLMLKPKSKLPFAIDDGDALQT
jgi:hypothetical protein